MRKHRYMWVVSVTGLLLWAATAGAQTDQPSIQPVDKTDTREGAVVVPVKPTAPDTTILGLDVARPVRPERQDLPPEVMERLRLFEKYRRVYLERQEAIRKESLSATDEDRAKLRERLQQLRERWLDVNHDRREAIKDRQEELKKKLEHHRQVIESARDDARQTARDNLLDQREQILEKREDAIRRGITDD